MSGIKETSEVIDAGFDVAIAGLKLKKDGLAGGVMSLAPLYGELQAAWKDSDQIKLELNDLDAQEIEALTAKIQAKTFELLLAMGMDANSKTARYLRNIPRTAALANHVYREANAIYADINGVAQPVK